MKKSFLLIVLLVLSLCLLLTSCELLEEWVNSSQPSTEDPTGQKQTDTPKENDPVEGSDPTSDPDAGNEQKDPEPEHKHTWDDGVLTKAATCKETGEKRLTCTVCKETKTVTVPKLLEHSWDEGKITTAATCANEGLKTFTCIICGETRTEAIAKIEHTWNAGVVTKAATTTAEGVKTFTCTGCGATKTETIPKETAVGGGGTSIPETPVYVTQSGARYQLNPDKKGYTLVYLEDDKTTAFTIPATVKSKPVTAIDEEAFMDLSSLISVTIGSNVKSIGARAFANCTGLLTISIPNKVEEIGSAAFQNCTALQVVTIGSGVEELPDPALSTEEETFVNAFDGCNQIAFLTLGDNLIEIPAGTFDASDCSLVKVTLGRYLEETNGAFQNAVGKKLVYIDDRSYGDAILADPVKALVGFIAKNQSKINVPDVSISDNYQDDFIFYQDASGALFLMTYIGLGQEEKVDPMADNDSTKKVLQLPADRNGKPYSIHPYAFYGRTDLKAVFFEEIDRYYQEELYQVDSIGESAFEGCTNLKSIQIPDSVNAIGKTVLKDCAALETITFLGLQKRWEEKIEKDETWDQDAGAYQMAFSYPEEHEPKKKLEAEVPSTCIKTGIKAHYLCKYEDEDDDCELWFDEDYRELPENFFDIPVAEHTLGAWSKRIDPTCEGKGAKGHYTCSVCEKYFDADGKELKSLEIPAAGHTYGEWVDEIPATCTENGAKGHYTCSACGIYFDANHKLLDSLLIPAGHNYEKHDEVAVNACADGMLAHYLCTGCGTYFDIDTEKTEVTKASLVISATTAHTYSDWIEEKSVSSCTVNGTKGHYRCTVCNANFDAEHQKIDDLTIPAPGKHTYSDWIEEVPATCTENGTLAHYACTVCKMFFNEDYHSMDTVDIPAGHDYEWFAPAAPCVDGLLEHYVCTKCDLYFDAEQNEAELETLASPHTAEHDYGEWIEEVLADRCVANGTAAHYSCKVCGKYFDADGKELKSLEIPAAGHTYGEWVDEIPATCTESGTKAHYICSVCSFCFDVEYKPLDDLSLPLKEHTYSDWIEEVPATCEEKGSKAHFSCTVCDASFDEKYNPINAVISATGHSYGKWNDKVPASCTEDGCEGHFLCKRCGEAFDAKYKKLDTTVIPAGHDYGELIEEVPATCADGMAAHYFCKNCGKYFDKDKDKEEKDVAELRLVATAAHDYKSIEEDPATCDDIGFQAHYTCTSCGKYFDTEKAEVTKESLVIPAIGHSYGEWVDEIPATCTENGTKGHYTCSTCGRNFNDENRRILRLTIFARGHHLFSAWIAEVSATCTEDGVKGHYLCTSCGASFDALRQIIDDLSIPATGHNYGDDNICDICGYEKPEE